MIALALERIFIACVLIAIAALLLAKQCFDTVDFIPFVTAYSTGSCSNEIRSGSADSRALEAHAKPDQCLPSGK
ncbi:hypothetical protein OSTOST_19154 [Ostertagia ostertagi]